jgi:hypothetical protein
MTDETRNDLPARIPKLPARQKVDILPTRKISGLTDEHTGELVSAGVQLLKDAGAIARELVEIQKIRTGSHARVSEIDAYTRQQVEILRAYIEKTRAGHEGVRTRGQEIRGIIESISMAVAQLPDSDAAARKALIDSLPRLAELVVEDGKV